MDIKKYKKWMFVGKEERKMVVMVYSMLDLMILEMIKYWEK